MGHGTLKPQPLALSIQDAARVLSVSRDTFERHVMSELRLVRIGRRLLVPVRELDNWLDRRAAIPLVAELSTRRSHPPSERTRVEL